MNNVTKMGKVNHNMRLIGRMILEDLKQEHSDVVRQIDAWCADVEACSWDSPHDVKQRYGSADFPGSNKAIFNIKGNKYRILTTIDYQRKMVVVEKAGTHSEYNAWRIK